MMACVCLWQDLAVGNNVFESVTLTVTFVFDFILFIYLFILCVLQTLSLGIRCSQTHLVFKYGI